MDIYTATIAHFSNLMELPTGTSDDQVHQIQKLTELRRHIEADIKARAEAEGLSDAQVDALQG